MEIDKVIRSIRLTWTDVDNAILDKTNPDVISRVKKLTQLAFTVKKMSTPHIGILVNIICSNLSPDETYLNIGVWNGYTFFSGILGNENINAIANDAFMVYTDGIGYTGNSDKLGRYFGKTEEIFMTEYKRLCFPEKHKIFISDCWEFLSKYKDSNLPKVGFYFYDADHSYESQRRALETIYPFLSDECIIMIDDTNSPDTKMANDEFFCNKQFGFERILDISTPCNGWPTWWNGIQLYGRR